MSPLRVIRGPGARAANWEGGLGLLSIDMHSEGLWSIAAGLADWEILSERQLRVEESDRGELVASAKLGSLPGGRAALHRPDLALVSADARALAIEIELSVKAPRRLAAICRGWARARHVSHVYYLADDAPARAVGRAIAETRAGDRITVVALEDVASLIAVECGEVGDGVL
jgi:hypothetical protein